MTGSKSRAKPKSAARSNSKGKAQSGQKLHPRNKHQGRYDLQLLAEKSPELTGFITENPYGNLTLNFHDPAAVKALNRALLLQYYGIAHWNIPDNYLCPPIPGRADYIHHLADLLAQDNDGVVPKGKQIRALDIGVGANCIYPIVGSREYGWSFVGAELDTVALNTAAVIVEANPSLKPLVKLRRQPDSMDIFNNIIKPGELFDLTLCNPPFHASSQDAAAGSQRKLDNLNRGKSQVKIRAGKSPVSKPDLNFGGQNSELWCEGGEAAFIQRMIGQSRELRGQCYWFSSLVSKKENLPAIYRSLKQAGANRVETVAMAQGQKVSRFVAWSFLGKARRQKWREERWLE
ncbi:23S rRNA (adenine(1618)-N(6))-methyltransferase RlmF [Amphritea sp. HPY]|uniref:23S rRNA (adenine(1618)-N(6))-methyltransferase RlmF n=1 Tax=Amphritea sp. HPY TaxID=3421652 RepID=UPI003D7E6A8C